MSYILDIKNNYLVTHTSYNQYLCQDIYSRALVGNSIGPMICDGLQVSVGSGLSLNISAGMAYGQFIQVPTVASPQLSFVNIPASTIDIPSNKSGYVYFNVNVQLESPESRNIYEIGVSSQSSSMDFTPLFSETIPTPQVDEYPYAVIVLAYVIANPTDIGSLNTSYYLGNRSYDLSGGWLPEVGSNYVRYIDGFTTQWGELTVNGSNVYTIDFPIPFAENPFNVIVPVGRHGEGLITVTSVPMLSFSTTGFQIRSIDYAAPSTVQWSAIGVTY